MSDKILPESEIAAAREIFEMVEMPKQGNRILDSHEALRGSLHGYDRGRECAGVHRDSYRVRFFARFFRGALGFVKRSFNPAEHGEGK